MQALPFIVVILLLVTYVIKGYNRQFLKMAEVRAETFRKSTEKMYDNIYELNISENRPEGKSSERYFESLGVPKYSTYDNALKIIAEKQIKEEFRKGYIDRFRTKNVLKEYEKGNTLLQYDFMVSEEGRDYFWMHIDANIYFCPSDDTVRMFTYRKNIDTEKKQEKEIQELAQIDEMTGVYNKMSTQRRIEEILSQSAHRYTFFIFDIDNFKQANDQYGHAFGDKVILQFVNILKEQFRRDDILGRIGGDEFAAFIRIPDRAWAVRKAAELVEALNTFCVEEEADVKKQWSITASIGAAVSPEDGADFTALYRHADAALYETKRRGKNGFNMYVGSDISG